MTSITRRATRRRAGITGVVELMVGVGLALLVLGAGWMLWTRAVGLAGSTERKTGPREENLFFVFHLRQELGDASSFLVSASGDELVFRSSRGEFVLARDGAELALKRSGDVVARLPGVERFQVKAQAGGLVRLQYLRKVLHVEDILVTSVAQALPGIPYSRVFVPSR